MILTKKVELCLLSTGRGQSPQDQRGLGRTSWWFKSILLKATYQCKGSADAQIPPLLDEELLSLAALIVPKQDYSLGRIILQNPTLLLYSSAEILNVWIKTVMCLYQWCPYPQHISLKCVWLDVRYKTYNEVVKAQSVHLSFHLSNHFWVHISCCFVMSREAARAVLSAALSPSAVGCWLCSQLWCWYQMAQLQLSLSPARLCPALGVSAIQLEETGMCWE